MTKHPRTHPTAQDEDEGEVERSLLAYLRQHPQAADTLRGIVSWWLPRQRYENDCQRIEQVLGGLVARGVLRRDPLPHGEVLYALNQHAGPAALP